MTKRTSFDPEVVISLGGERHAVDSVQMATEMLVSDIWPAYGAKGQCAAEVLIHALHDRATPEEARRSFREAAEEAGILIGDDRVPIGKVVKRRR